MAVIKDIHKRDAYYGYRSLLVGAEVVQLASVQSNPDIPGYQSMRLQFVKGIPVGTNGTFRAGEEYYFSIVKVVDAF